MTEDKNIEKLAPVYELLKWDEWLKLAALIMTKQEFEHNTLIKKVRKIRDSAYEATIHVLTPDYKTGRMSAEDICTLIALDTKPENHQVNTIAVFCIQCQKDTSGNLDDIIEMFARKTMIHPDLIKGTCLHFQENPNEFEQELKRVYGGKMPIFRRGLGE